MPQNFDKFRVSMAGTTPKAALQAPEQLRGLPVGAGQQALDNGKIPTLEDLGLKPLNNASTEPGTSDTACLGGESEALKQLKRFLSIASSVTNNRGSAAPVAPGAANASSFSSSIAPWLATGCLSPRRMLEEAHKMLAGKTAGAGDGEGVGTTAAGSSLQWVQFELLWRDFFRLLTRRHSEVVLPRAKEAVTAAQATASPAFAMA
jgi:deoxyribodipyrimidine photolyase